MSDPKYTIRYIHPFSAARMVALLLAITNSLGVIMLVLSVAIINIATSSRKNFYEEIVELFIEEPIILLYMGIGALVSLVVSWIIGFVLTYGMAHLYNAVQEQLGSITVHLRKSK